MCGLFRLCGRWGGAHAHRGPSLLPGGEAAAPPAPLPALLGPRAKLTVLGLTDAPAAYAPLLKALDAFQREHHWPFATCTISSAQVCGP